MLVNNRPGVHCSTFFANLPNAEEETESPFSLVVRFQPVSQVLPSSFLLRIKAAATLVMRQAVVREVGCIIANSLPHHSQFSATGVQLLGLEWSYPVKQLDETPSSDIWPSNSYKFLNQSPENGHSLVSHSWSKCPSSGSNPGAPSQNKLEGPEPGWWSPDQPPTN